MPLGWSLPSLSQGGVSFLALGCPAVVGPANVRSLSCKDRALLPGSPWERGLVAQRCKDVSGSEFEN